MKETKKKLGLNLHNAFQYHTAHPEVKKKAQLLLQSCTFPTHVQQKVAVAVTVWQPCLLTVLILFAGAIRPNLGASRERYPQLTYCRVDLVTGGNNAGRAVKMSTTASEKKKMYHMSHGRKKKERKRAESLRLMVISIQNSRISHCIPSRPWQHWFLIKWVHLCMRYALHHPACIILETHDQF